MKLLSSFLAGLAVGLVACHGYIGTLEATIKRYEAHLHQRIVVLSRHLPNN